MKRLRAFLVAAGMSTAVLTVIAVVCGNSLLPRVCPAIGYAYTGAVELVFTTPPSSVAACFGEGCAPEPVLQNEERKWLVPQSPPYLNAPVSVTSIHVEAMAVIGGRTAIALPVETESTGEYPFGPGCGGPFRFKPAIVPLS